MDESQEAKTEFGEFQRPDRRLRKTWKNYGGVESVKKDKKIYQKKVHTINLYSKEKEEEKKDTSNNEQKEKENGNDIPKEEKFEE